MWQQFFATSLAAIKGWLQSALSCCPVFSVRAKQLCAIDESRYSHSLSYDLQRQTHRVGGSNCVQPASLSISDSRVYTSSRSESRLSNASTLRPPIRGSSPALSDHNSQSTEAPSIARETTMIFDRKYPTYRVSVFPIDDQAKELLHTEHMCLGSLPHGKEMVHLLLLQKRGNVKIMEVGAGLCLWVQSVASHLPDATIIATEIFDFEISIPNNVSVYLADVNDGLPFPRHELDYIHVRGQVGRIKGWQEFITDTFTQLAPGGYLEYYDISWEFIRARRVSELPDPWVECSQILSHVASYTGRTFHVSMDECKGWMQAAGYTIYHDNCYDISLAKSTAVRRMIINKIIGIYTFHHFMERWQLSEHRARIRMLERELENNCHNVVVQAVRVVGKKPGGEQQELVLQT